MITVSKLKQYVSPWFPSNCIWRLPNQILYFTEFPTMVGWITQWQRNPSTWTLDTSQNWWFSRILYIKNWKLTMGVFTGCLLWRADRMNLTDGSKIGYPNNELEGEYLKSTIQSVVSQVCKKLPSNSQVKNKHQLQTEQKETKVLNTRLIMFHESPWNPPSCHVISIILAPSVATRNSKKRLA